MTLWKLWCRAVPIASVAGLIVLVAPIAGQDGADCDRFCREAAALIERLALREGPTPVRERPGWAPPVRIVVPSEGWANLLRNVLGTDAEVVGVSSGGARNFSAVADLIEGADVLVGLCSPEIIRRGVNLKWVQLTNAGADSCTSIPEVAERGILVTNLQRILGPQIADHAIALMLALARGLQHYGAEQADGAWSADLRAIREYPFWEVEGKTMLVVGLGGIGTEIARRANGLGMRVQATRNSRREGPEFVEYVGLAHEVVELAANADVVVNATPLTPATRGMFDAAFFAAMKETAYFVNVGRGESVVTADLVTALQEGTIAGAGLDVTDPEPLPSGHPLWSMPNVILTPHIAAGSDLVGGRFRALVVENLRRYARGDPVLSVVDLARGY